jgi:cytidylate kinase
MDEPFLVAIDGPAGSGKSTLARMLAEELGLPYVNTGLMYRALARRALDSNVDRDDAGRLEDIVGELSFEIDWSERPPALLIGGLPAGVEYAAPEVETSVSAVARHPEVRRAMVARQRELGERGAVVEGRDIGTVVFPHAPVKIFLDASPAERAGRRSREQEGRTGVAEELARRDSRDARVNPFVPASDAVRIDTTELEPDQVLRRALEIVRERMERAE